MTDGRIKFSTGKEIEPNAGYVGLSPDFGISEGYDGTYCDYDEYLEIVDNAEPGDHNVLTHQEQLELCVIMISRWQAFMDKLTRGLR